MRQAGQAGPIAFSARTCGPGLTAGRPKGRVQESTTRVCGWKCGTESIALSCVSKDAMYSHRMEEQARGLTLG